jgi:REP element-mobilizing transposase RayT
MARKPREEVEGGIYHVYARGNAKQRIFLNEADRLIYLRMLAKESKRMRWFCLAYCLMETHLHLLLETPSTNLGLGMQRLQSRYARDFNDRHDRVGHVFQGRYGAVRVTSDEQLWWVAAYIARNPVVGGLCTRAEQWRWSSFAATIGHRRPQPWLSSGRLISMFAASTDNPVGRYIELTVET